jgi:hypothetical protein
VRWHITGGAATAWLDTDIEIKIFRDLDRTFFFATRTGVRMQCSFPTVPSDGQSSF